MRCDCALTPRAPRVSLPPLSPTPPHPARPLSPPLSHSSAVAAAAAPPLLEVRGLEASIAATGQQILKGVNLTLQAGEVRRRTTG